MSPQVDTEQKVLGWMTFKASAEPPSPGCAMSKTRLGLDDARKTKLLRKYKADTPLGAL